MDWKVLEKSTVYEYIIRDILFRCVSNIAEGIHECGSVIHRNRNRDPYGIFHFHVRIVFMGEYFRRLPRKVGACYVKIFISFFGNEIVKLFKCKVAVAGLAFKKMTNPVKKLVTPVPSIMIP